eukprot:768755-Hanusia_phi.AAC.5
MLGRLFRRWMSDGGGAGGAGGAEALLREMAVKRGGRVRRRREGAGGSPVVRINLWSSPRCASTSLMYSFAQRSDTKVVDEPLYAHYLKNIRPTAYRPYREEVLAAQVRRWNAGHVANCGASSTTVTRSSRRL